MRVLHILHESLPHISGFTIRSKYIFKHQKKFADIFVFTTFQYNRKKELEIYDKVPYFRMNQRISYLIKKYNKLAIRASNLIYKLLKLDIEKKFGRFLYFPVSFFTRYYLKRTIRAYNIDIIHQHSQYQVGNYSLKLARKLKIPYVYEVRGFIEESMLATSQNRRISDKSLLKFVYYRIKNSETKILKKADMVITLSEPMKDELLKRDINNTKIKVIPNCIDPNILESGNSANDFQVNLSEYDIVLGYFGQIRWLEGIDVLFRATAIIKKSNIKIKILLIGNIKEPYHNYLNELIRSLDLSDNVLFMGVLPHATILKYYSLVDMIILPRLNQRVCRIVTPLKPLEAMLFKTLTIASNLPALKYTISDGETGVLFEPENPQDLASKILKYSNNPEEKKRIEVKAYNNVKENFSWDKITPKYEKIYINLMRKK